MSTWDVRTASGDVVTNLADLASALFTSREDAAKQLLADAELVESAPAALLAEVKATARPKPGGGTPPPITTGSFVSWSGGKGRVDMVVSKGKVPGVEDDVEGTSKAPAARVVVWVDGKPTRKKIGKSTHVLKRIAPLGKPDKKDASAVLVETVADHEERCEAMNLPGYNRVTGEAVKTVYDRGVEAWPGEEKTVLSAEEWALGRVEHFVKVAVGEIESKDRAGHDTDLLSPGHPLVAGETVILDLADVDATVKALLDGVE